MIRPSSSFGEQEGIPRLLEILWERRRAVLLCMVASWGVAAIGYTHSPVRYKAESILALDVRKLQALPTESVVSPLPQESPVLRTELDIIGSRSMAERVLSSLQKAGQPDRAGVRNPPFVGNVLSGAETKTKIDELMENVRVINDGRSYTIYISYYANDPVYAAKVANAFGEAYIEYQIGLQTTATRRVSEWLGERLGTLRTKLEESERQATEFREKAGLVDLGGMPLQAQRLSGLNTELTSLDARLAGAKARLQTALEAQRSGDGLGLTEVLSSPAIQLLRAEQARVIRAIAEIDESGAHKNPQLLQLTSQLTSLNGQIGKEISQIIASLRNEIDVTERQQREVRNNLLQVQEEISATNTAVVQSAQLDREAAANRSIYETYLARYKETIGQDGIATAEARIISRAMPSNKPTKPDILLWGVLGLLLGACSGLFAALLLNFMDRSIGSIGTLQKKIGLSVIGRIPRVPAKICRNKQGMFLSEAKDLYAAFADLQTYLQLVEKKAKVIAFTSSVDGEGRSFVIANLARSLSLSGVRLVVIDANLMDPAVGREFDVKPMGKLADAFDQEIVFNRLIQHDHSSSVDLIATQADDEPPSLTLGSKRFAALISEARERYELVLIDAPSAAHEFDLLRVASLSDVITLVVRPDIAKTLKVQDAVISLRLAGASISGIVLNCVRRNKKMRKTRRWQSSQSSEWHETEPVFSPGPAVVPHNAR